MEVSQFDWGKADYITLSESRVVSSPTCVVPSVPRSLHAEEVCMRGLLDLAQKEEAASSFQPSGGWVSPKSC